jgi:hypothetical protein
MNREELQIEQSDIDNGKRQAEKRLKQLGWTSEQVAHVRIKAKTDLWFLAYGILGYTKLSKSLHGDFCVTLKSTENEKYRMNLYPRSHFKTTIQTKTDSVQIALPDDLKNGIYPRNLGPNVRILIGHEKREKAAEFLFEITQHFTMNPLLMSIFPECVPTLKLQRLNKFELELPRTSIWTEPTFATIGVGGKTQGSHHDFIKLDDIYGAEARDSKAERETAIMWFDNIQSFFVTPKTDHLDICGTRWAFDDVYAHAMKVYGVKINDYSKNNPALKDYLRPDGKLFTVVRKAIENGKPIFPEHFDLSDFEILKKNPKVWNAQYANDPREGAATFDPAWLQYYERNGKDLVTFSLNGSETIHFESLDRLLFLDPAVTGLSGISVTGTLGQNIYVLDAIKKSFKTEELLNQLFSLIMKWRPRAVVVEEVNFSALYDHIIRNEMNKRGVKFQIIMHKVSRKEDRKIMDVSALANYFSAKQIWFHNSQIDLIEEFSQFGATDNYHILDSLSFGPKYWKSSFNSRLRDRFKDAETDVMSGLDRITGYSKI